MQLKTLLTSDEIAESFETFLELRPSLSDLQSFIKQMAQQQKEGYEIIAIIEDKKIAGCIGFRIMTMLAWGKILYIDDLITREAYRNKGYGKMLLDHANKIAKERGCDQVHLDTGYTRHAAHRVYLNKGFEFLCHHLSLKLK